MRIVIALAVIVAFILPIQSWAVTVHPTEDPQAILHNPDMGWVLYENYPVDSRLATWKMVPPYEFPEVDAVAVMFAWSDVEKREGRYDFSKVDEAFDYWKAKGKEVQLRMSTESLLWWNLASPPAGKGIPDYVLAHIPLDQKQTRISDGIPYTVVDARNPFYLARLKAFLNAVNNHFRGHRSLTYIDLRAFGLWGEWHTGYKYKTVAARREGLKNIIDAFSSTFKSQWLSLSYSYDPDSPESYRSGPTDRYDPAFTTPYKDFLRYSAFDYAMTKPNITLRRDGAGGAVHSNERKLCEEAFNTLRKGPMMCEFLGGYIANSKAGDKWIDFMVNDALSLHPNYIALLGWQLGDAHAFIKERPDLIKHGLLNMGYRLVPTTITYPQSITAGDKLALQMEWLNRGVGRAMRDYKLDVLLTDANGKPVIIIPMGAIPTARWIKGQTYLVTAIGKLRNVAPGTYDLHIRLTDPKTRRIVSMPLAGASDDGSYRIGEFRVGQ